MMTERVEKMRKFFVVDKKQKERWQEAQSTYCLAEQYAAEGLNDYERAALRLIYVLEQEQPVIYDDERIAFTRTVTNIPEMFTETEMEKLRQTRKIHEKGDVCNINVNYMLLMRTGLDETMVQLARKQEAFRLEGQTEKASYVKLQADILNSVRKLAQKYQKLAAKNGNKIVADTLLRIPGKAPDTFLEALQMFRILHFTMWCGRNYHNTIGRFDQYLYPYLKADMDKGLYDEDSALELLEEFFLTFNRDSDLYPGMQQGDNGQSMVLGGVREDGTDSFNLLSRLCLQASLDLKLIDPKINLRVHKNTPMSTYILGTKLTKQGLGFPQYSNDDVVIPGLMALGYEKADAFNYVVAACWEFIIPGRGMDIPNIGALSFPDAVEKAVFEKLSAVSTYEAFAAEVNRNIEDAAGSLCRATDNVYLFPAPFLSLMMEDCVADSHDVSLGCGYNNYGFHGTGVATAADSMAAIRTYIFEEKSVSPEELKEALSNNFEGFDLLLNKLRYDAPKMGNNEGGVDAIGGSLLGQFADALKGRINDRGGIFRAGTGSAMYYLWHAKEMPATPDGRRKGEGFGANYSPSLFAGIKGPVSIIKSFSRPELKRVVNGGPLTLELHDTVFRTEESLEKTAALVRSFMDLGGHQLQLNAVNRETMLEAQKNPDNFRNLIVRVWGWSGYFVELDQEYQDHIIKRMELAI